MAGLILTLLAISSVVISVQCDEVDGWRVTSKNMAPYVVSIQAALDESKFNHICTGNIIKEKYILTSASCFDGIQPSQKVGVNTGVKEHHDEKGEFINVLKVHLHPEYKKDDPLKKFDVAVLELESAIEFRRLAQVIRVPSKSVIPEGKGMLAGWGGVVKVTDKPSEEINIANVAVLADEECKKFYPDITAQQFCVGGLSGSNAPCRGNAGIALGQPIRGFTATGLSTLWPENCEGPALFTSVSPYVDFIAGVTDTPVEEDSSASAE